MARPVRSSRKTVQHERIHGETGVAEDDGAKVPVEETSDLVPAKRRGRPKPRVPVKKTPAKKGNLKKAAKKKAGRKGGDSDEDEYVPEKEEPDEALDVKLEDEQDDDFEFFDHARNEEEDENIEENPPKRKREKRRRKPATKATGPVTKKIVRVDPVTGEHKRVLDTHVEPDVEDSGFQMQLVDFLESGRCPKCDSKLVRGHQRHLRLCRGPTEDTIRRNNEREVMASLPPEARAGKSQDAAKMKLMARLRKVSIKGLKTRSDDGAIIIVKGSTGRDYEVSLKDGNRGGPYSNCVDARTKRHDCKHCSSIILRLGFDLEVTDEEWNGMWRMHLDDAIETGGIREL